MEFHDITVNCSVSIRFTEIEEQVAQFKYNSDAYEFAKAISNLYVAKVLIRDNNNSVTLAFQRGMVTDWDD
jgi:hypothetical protein